MCSAVAPRPCSRILAAARRGSGFRVDLRLCWAHCLCLTLTHGSGFHVIPCFLARVGRPVHGVCACVCGCQGQVTRRGVAGRLGPLLRPVPVLVSQCCWVTLLGVQQVAERCWRPLLSRCATVVIAAARHCPSRGVCLVNDAVDAVITMARGAAPSPLPPPPGRGNSRDGDGGGGVGAKTPIMLAVDSLHPPPPELLVELVERGGDVNAALDTAGGFTALMFAVSHGHVATVGTLLELGARPSLTSRLGTTARSLSSLRGMHAITGLLDAASARDQAATKLQAARRGCRARRDRAAQVSAATRIQGATRGRQGRGRAEQQRCAQAATRIQAVRRGQRGRRAASAAARESERQRVAAAAAAVRLQASVRGWLGRQRLAEQQRVVARGQQVCAHRAAVVLQSVVRGAMTRRQAANRKRRRSRRRLAQRAQEAEAEELAGPGPWRQDQAVVDSLGHRQEQESHRQSATDSRFSQRRGHAGTARGRRRAEALQEECAPTPNAPPNALSPNALSPNALPPRPHAPPTVNHLDDTARNTRSPLLRRV
jgi:hypothetical protein